MSTLSCAFRVAHIFICASLFSCTAVPPTIRYIPPTTGLTAKLQVRSARTFGSFSIFENAQKCSSPRLIADGRTDNNFQMTADTTIPGDRLVTVWFMTNWQCNALVTFEAQSGKTYAIHANTTSSCSLTLEEVPENGGRVRRVRWVERKQSENALLSNSYCTDVDLNAEIAKPPKRDVARMKMEELDALLPGRSAQK